MISPDVNVLVHAFRSESPDHQRAASWLVQAMSESEPIGLIPSVMQGFVRVVTNPRVYANPTPVPLACSQIDGLLSQPIVTIIHSGPRNWEVFSRLCREASARGNLVSDAAHAAVAIEHGATWVTLDRDFARFPGLRWESPHAG